MACCREQTSSTARYPGASDSKGAGVDDLRHVAAAMALVRAIREHGHRAARLDPLGSPPPGDPALDPATYHLNDADLDALPASIVGGPLAERALNASEAIRALCGVYQGSSGYEFDHVSNAEERAWLHEVVE